MPGTAATTRTRRRRRWLIAIAVLLIAFYLGLPRLGGAIVAGQLDPILGGEVSIRRIWPVDWGAGWVVEDLEIRAPGWTGDAAEVVRLDRVVVNVDRASLLSGTPRILDVTIDGGRLRLAEDPQDPGRINALALRPAPEPSDSPGPSLITVARLEVESGTEEEGAWTSAGSRWFSGSVRTEPDRPSHRELILFEVDEEGERLPQALVLHGGIDAGDLRAELRVDRLDLGPEGLRIAPPSVRAWCEELELDGEVASFILDWRPGERLGARLDISDLSLRLPDLGGEAWARFRGGRIEGLVAPPRMRVTEGTIVFDGDELRFEGFEGVLGDSPTEALGVPFGLGFSIDLGGLTAPGMSWSDRWRLFDETIKAAPFDLGLAIRDFKSSLRDSTMPPGDGEVPLDLPLAAARVLENLSATSWSLQIEVDLHRDPPLAFADGRAVASPVKASGQLTLKEGRGSYFRFPYPLREVAGYITFEDDEATIEYLRGRGESGADILLRGTIIQPDDDVSIDLTISSPNVPTDELLEQALEPGPRRLLTTLFDRREHARFGELGLLATQEDVRRAEVELHEVARLLAEGPSEEDRRALEDRRAWLEARIKVGAFELGGRVSLNLRLEQGLGADAPLITTGTIGLTRSGVMLEGFPYPVTVLGGEILVEDESIGLSGEHGLPFVTPGGGRGRITGVIGIPRTPRDPSSDEDPPRRFEPLLRVTVAEDRISPPLLAAIPSPSWMGGVEVAAGASAQGWHDLVDAAGRVDLHGEVTPGADGVEPEWAFTALLRECTVAPRPALVETLAEIGLRWPEGQGVVQGEGEVRLRPGLVECDRIVAVLPQARGDAPLALSGRILPREDSLDLRLAARGLDAATWLEATDDDPSVEGEDGIDWLARRVDGWLDVDLRFDQSSEEAVGLSALRTTTHVVAGQVEVDVPEAEGSPPPRLRLALEEGAIDLSRGGVDFQGAAISLASARGSEGRIRFDGGRSGDDAAWALRVEWIDGDLDGLAAAIATNEYLEIAGDAWDSLSPAGRFDARFAITAETDAEDFAVELAARDASVLLHGELIRLSSDRPGLVRSRDASILVDTGRLWVGDDRSTLMELLATVSRTDPRTAEVKGTVEFARLPSDGLAVLPPSIRAEVARLDLSSTGPVRIEGIELRAGWASDAPLESPSDLDLAANVRTRGTGFEAGLRFREVDAEAAIRAVRTVERPLEVEAAILADRAVLLDRELADASARLRFDERDGSLRVDAIEARLYEGFLTGTLVADLGSRSYSLAAVLDEVEVGQLIDGEPLPDSEPRPERGFSAGLLRGRVAIEGWFGDPAPSPFRVGRGRIRIENGALAKDPILMRLLQMSQLTLPLNDAIADADIRFHIEDDRLEFERFALACDTLRLDGAGTLDLASMELETNFTAHGTLPGVSDLLSPLAGLLYSIDMKGPLADPDISLRPLPVFSTPAPPPRSLSRSASGSSTKVSP